MSTSRKERFKLYKAKKRWLIAGLAFAGAAMMTGGQVSADQVSDAHTAPVEAAVSTQPDASSATGAVVTATSATLTTDATTNSTKQEAVEPASTPAPVTDTTTPAPVAPTTEVTADQAVVDTPAVQQASTPASTTAATPNATQESAQPVANNTTVAHTWDYATDTNVQATVGTTINGVENSKGDVVANGGDFTQSNSARVMNGYSVTVSIDNTKEMYHNGDTIQIPIYGKMVSANTSVDTQNFDVVSAKGMLMNSGKTIGTYVVADGHLAITLTDELLGVSESTLNITGTDASPVASTAIWFNEKANATVYFGNSQVSGSLAFVAGNTKGYDKANTTQWGYSKSDNIGVESFFQDNDYLNAIYNGDAKTAASEENGKYGTDDLVQIQRITVNSGTVKAVTSNRTYANYWVPRVSGDSFIATSVTAAAIKLSTIEQEVKSNFKTDGMDIATLEGEVAKSLKSAGIGAYTIIKIDDNNYLVAYNIGNPYTDYSTEGLSKDPANDFTNFLVNGKNQGNLTASQLAKLQDNIDHATAGKKSVGAGSVVHIFDVAFADNGTKNSVTSTLDTYNVNGEKLGSTGKQTITTTPDSQNFNGQAQLKVLYVDGQGNTLAPAVTKLAKPGTTYNESAPEIPGFTFSHTNGNAQGKFGAANTSNSVVFVYDADEQTAMVPNDPIVAEMVPNDPIVTEMVPNDPIVTEMVPNDPIVTGMVPNDPIVTGMVPNDPIVTEMVPNDPIVTGMVPNDPIVTEMVPNDPIVTEMVPNDPIVTGMVPNDPIVTEMVPNDPIVTGMVPNDPIVTGMVPNDPIVTGMVPNDPIVTEMVPNDPIVTGMVPNDPIVTEMVPNDPIVTGMVPNDPIITGMVPNDPIVTEMVPNDPIVTGMVPNDPIITGMVPNDPIVTEMVPNDPIVTEMVPNDPIVTGMVPNDPIVTEMVPNNPIVTAMVPNAPIMSLGNNDTNHSQNGANGEEGTHQNVDNANAVNRAKVANSTVVSLPETDAKSNQDKNSLLVVLAVLTNLVIFATVLKRK
ncbi:MucBP domain-containing protein [Weissella confusa]|uniref:MucBP domain-containing protein n=1 Tax=Weissella confusa TaxID=1583 RepID=UPI0035A3B7ED